MSDHWIAKMWCDYFLAMGHIVFFGGFISVTFFGGYAENVSLGWFLFPPLIFAWLRGEFCHWPKEQSNDR